MGDKNSSIVIIGNGIAGNSAASAIRKFNRDIAITMISEEAFPEYCNPALPNYISGELERKRVFLKTFDDYSKEGIKAIFGQRVTALDIKGKELFLEGKNIHYDKLIIATGGQAIIPSIEGVDKKGVFTLRSLADADKIFDYSGERVVVIGSGLVGIEISMALKKKGWEVVNISRRWVLPRVFDEKPSSILKEIMEEHGIKMLTWERIGRILGDNEVEGVVTDKQEIKCDMVILAPGMMPRAELAQQAELEIGEFGGIRTDEQMMTSVEDIYACGDCTETRELTTNKYRLILLWGNAKRQGEVAGLSCIGIPKCYPGSINVISIDVFGTHAVSIGGSMDMLKGTDLEVIENHNNYYYRLLVADGVLVGAQFVGKTEDIGPLINVIRKSARIERLEKIIINTKGLLSKNPWYYKIYPYIRRLN
jgi:NADH oxidase (H2O2-forming)